MSRTKRYDARSVIVTALGIGLVLTAGWFYLRSSDALKLRSLDAELARIEKLAVNGNVSAVKAALSALVEAPISTWFVKSDEIARKDEARIALARILDREREMPRAVRLLNEVSTAAAKADADYLLGRFEARKRLAEADRLASRGAWADAEKIYAADIDFGADSLPHRLTFHKLLVRQGRTSQAREVYAGGIYTVEKPQDVLLSLWVMDTEEPRVAEWEADVAAARDLAPEDRRVRLAQAFLARSSGRFDEAFGILSALIANRADSPDSHDANLMAFPERHAALMLGLDSPEHFDRCMHLAFPDQANAPLKLPRFDAFQALARTSRTLDQKAEEKRWLDEILKISPMDRSTLSRLAELSRASDRIDAAAEFDRKKSEAETLRVEYARLARKAAVPNQADATKLAEFAEMLGMKFDSWAWARIASRQPVEPGSSPAAESIDLARNMPPEFWRRIATSVTGPDESRGGPGRKASQYLQFVDIAERSGLGKFKHISAGSSAQLTPPVSSAGGVAVFDFDSDGHQDVYAVQSGTFPPSPAEPAGGDKLFRNRGDGTFLDVTVEAGIDRFPRGFGHGVAIGDIDNDGHPDIFVTRWRSYALYRNRGDGTFEDVTVRFGLDGDRDWPTSAAFADFDNDGDLDLYVCHYLEWIEGKAYPCIDPSKPNSYDCRPLDFPAMQDRLYRNDGGRFQDVSTVSGIAAIDRNGRGFGVVAADVNEDGLVDLFVANDTSPNFLLINKGGMKFEDEALISGVAANAQGGFQAGMGVAAADVTGDGRVDLAVTNYFNESTTIFVNLGNGLFADRSAVLGVAAPSRFLLGFGILLTDFDNDGILDYMTANGHVTDGRPAIPWRMPLQVLRGTAEAGRSKPEGKRDAIDEMRFVEDGPKAGELFSRQLMARGLASGDLDGDGLEDVVVQSQNDELIHAKNESLASVPESLRPHWIGLVLEGTVSNRDAVGAVITAKIRRKSGDTIERKIWRSGGGSFQSASSNRLHFGLGYDTNGEPIEAVESIRILWPSGKVEDIRNPAIDKVHKLRESH